MRKLVAALSLSISFLVVADAAYSMSSLDSEERERYLTGPEIVVNRPVNIQGLTGLIITNSAYTQPKGKFTMGLSALAENSSSPDFSVARGILAATYGATERIEFGVRSQMIATNLGSATTRETGAGDTDLLVKWRLSTQGEDLPAIAVGAGLTLPTGSKEKGFRECDHEIVKLMLIGAHEKEMPGDFVLGLYAEGQVVFVDLLEKDDSRFSEKYGVLNAGILLSVVESRRLQFILEYNLETRKDVPTLYEKNYSAFTPGLRYVTSQLNITAGVQFLSKDEEMGGNNERYIATISYQF